MHPEPSVKFISIFYSLFQYLSPITIIPTNVITMPSISILSFLRLSYYTSLTLLSTVNICLFNQYLSIH